MPYTTDQVYDALYHIAQTPGRLDKIGLLKMYLNDSTFKRVVLYAYNPFKTYGIAKFGSYTCKGPFNDFGEAGWRILDGLANRTQDHESVYRHMEIMSMKSAILFERICQKDLRSGFTAASVNAAVPGTVPVFKCMLAHPFEEKRLIQPYYLAQPKIDGNRALAWVSPTLKTVRFYSRTGRPITSLDHFAPDLLKLCDSLNRPVVFDGEAAGIEFNQSSGQIRQQSGTAVGVKYHIFDFMDAEVFTGVASPPCLLRYSELEELFRRADIYGNHKFENIQLIENHQVRGLTEIEVHYKRWREQGLEGAIIKDPTAPYELKRSHAWLKMKDLIDVDVPIVDIIEGTGKYVGMMGALVVRLETGVQCKVGTGFSDEQRREIWDHWHNEGVPPFGHPALKGQIIEVHAHEWTPDGSLRHPRFIRFRPDKDAG